MGLMSESGSGSVRYSRVVRLPGALALGTAVSVGLGVYTLLGQFVRLSSYESTVIPYLLMILLMLPAILTLAERGGVVAGQSPHALTRLNPYHSFRFAHGWLTLIGYVSLIALLSWGVALHLNLLWQPMLDLSDHLPELATAVLGLAALSYVLRAGLRWQVRGLLVYLAIGLVILLSLWRLTHYDLETVAQRAVSSSSPLESLSLATLMVSGLWGSNFILHARNQTRRPVRTIPLALLLTLLVGGGLGALAALVVENFSAVSPANPAPLAAVLDHLVNAPLPLETWVYALLGLSIASTALNRGFLALTDLMDEMAEEGYWPDWLTDEHENGRPLLVRRLTLAILGGALLLTLTDITLLMGLAAMTYLWSTAVLYLPELLHPRYFRLPANRRPRLPFHPLFPAVTAAIGLLLPFTLGRSVWSVGLVLAGLGLVYYLAYGRGRSQAIYRQDVVLGEELFGAPAASDFTVMVAMAGSDDLTDLIALALRLARAHNGRVLILQTLQLPYQMSDQLKRQAAAAAYDKLAQLAASYQNSSKSSAMWPLVRLSPAPALGILEAVREEKVDCLLLSWPGPNAPQAAQHHQLLLQLVHDAECEVAVLHGRLPSVVERVVVAADDPSNMATGTSLAQRLVQPDGDVVSVSLPTTDLDADDHSLETAVAAAESSDLLMLGLAREGLFDRPHFGGAPLRLAQKYAGPVVLVRARLRQRYSLLQHAWGYITDLVGKVSGQRRPAIITHLRETATPNVDFFVLAILAAIIASMGLLKNDSGTILGAMLVAPLMSPILAMAMGMVIGDWQQSRLAIESFSKGAALFIIIGFVMTLTSPTRLLTEEIALRSAPNTLDLIIALAAGAAAGYAMCRREVAAVLPGVAMAATLDPPLAVVGYGLATSQLEVVLGAFLFFLTNFVAILVSASFVFLALGFQPPRGERRELLHGLEISLGTLLFIALILVGLTAVATRRISRELQVEAVFNSAVVAEAMEVTDLAITSQDDGFLIEATMLSYADATLSPETLRQMENDLTTAVGGPVTIEATMVRANRLAGSNLAERRELALKFEEAIANAGGQVESIVVDLERGSFFVDALVVAYQGSTLDEALLNDIQQQLRDELGRPVDLQVRVSRAELYDVKGDGGATAVPPETSEAQKSD